MKKLFLSFLLGFSLFFGFSNAGVVTFVNSGGSYYPSDIDFVFYGYLDRNYVLDYSCSYEYCNIDVGSDCIIDYEGDMNVPLTAQCSFYNGNYDVSSENNLFDYITVDFGIAYSGSLMSSSDCELEYNLIPVSSVDQNYCELNNLCSSSSNSGDLIWSNLYINNILHPGRSSIFVNIPDYISWDYNFNDTDFNIYVGSGYDVDYIDSIVSINSYRPTSEDFTNVFVGGFALIMPYVVIILFVVFIRKFIKRIFK